MIYTQPHAPGCVDRLSELLGCSQGVWGAEPPDKLENSAGGTRRAMRDEFQRHVHKLVNKVSEDGHVSVGVRQSSVIGGHMRTLGKLSQLSQLSQICFALLALSTLFFCLLSWALFQCECVWVLGESVDQGEAL